MEEWWSVLSLLLTNIWMSFSQIPTNTESPKQKRQASLNKLSEPWASSSSEAKTSFLLPPKPHLPKPSRKPIHKQRNLEKPHQSVVQVKSQHSRQLLKCKANQFWYHQQGPFHQTWKRPASISIYQSLLNYHHSDAEMKEPKWNITLRKDLINICIFSIKICVFCEWMKCYLNFKRCRINKI